MGLKCWALNIARDERVIIYMILGESIKMKIIEAYCGGVGSGILLKNKAWRGLGLVQQLIIQTSVIFNMPTFCIAHLNLICIIVSDTLFLLIYWCYTEVC